jgi:hypothetical protein
VNEKRRESIAAFVLGHTGVFYNHCGKLGHLSNYSNVRIARVPLRQHEHDYLYNPKGEDHLVLPSWVGTLSERSFQRCTCASSNKRSSVWLSFPVGGCRPGPSSSSRMRWSIFIGRRSLIAVRFGLAIYCRLAVSGSIKPCRVLCVSWPPRLGLSQA